MMAFSARAYAKINLFLKITGIRKDGYHTIETVFQTVSLCDHISLILHRRGGISLRTNRPYIPRDERNIAYKAAQLFFEKTGIKNSGIYINIKKGIPVGAGMAGGSTDGAAVLKLLNKAYKSPVSQEELLSLGLELGADVPFCIRGGAAFAQGIGEKMSDVRRLPNCNIVICKPNISVSTKQAYALLDQKGTAGGGDTQRMLKALEIGGLDNICKEMHNDFQQPIGEEHRCIFEIKDTMLKNGAQNAMMTGSGSAVFGIFTRKEPAERTYKELKKIYRDVFFAKPI